MKNYILSSILGIMVVAPMLAIFVVPSFSFENKLTQVFGVQMVHAEGLVKCDRCKFQDLITTAEGFVKWLIQIGAVIAAIMFGYAGFLYMTAQGDPGKISAAHKIFISVVVGLVIMLASWLFIELIVETLVEDGESVKDVFSG